jgi:hypothetical protein
MTKCICGTAIMLALCAASVLAGVPVQNESLPAGRIDPRIGPANPHRCRSVRDAQDWENPYLVICRDGIQVIAKGVPSGRQTIASADLQRTLIELTVAAWPYGRVVAVSESPTIESGH